MRARHWDWLHVITIVLALVSFADADRRVVSAARVATWPSAQGVITSSSIDTFYVTFVARHGRVYANRRVATYAFDVGGRTYHGNTLSWYPLRDAKRLGIRSPLLVHFDGSDPRRNSVFAPPAFTVWIEAVAGILLVLFSAFSWNRRKFHESLYGDYDADEDVNRVVTLHVPIPPARAQDEATRKG